MPGPNINDPDSTQDRKPSSTTPISQTPQEIPTNTKGGRGVDSLISPIPDNPTDTPSILDPDKVLIPTESQHPQSHTTFDGRVLQFAEKVRKARFGKTRRVSRLRGEKFLLALAKGPNVSRACRESGLCRGSAEYLKDTYPDFAAAWREAEEMGIDSYFEELEQSFLQGDIEPVVSKGQIVTYVRKKDRKVGMWLMERLRPDRFAPRQKIEHSGEIVHFHFDVSPDRGPAPRTIDIVPESATIPLPLPPETPKQEQNSQ